MRRLVAVDLEMLDRERAVVRRHFLVMLFRDRIGRCVRPAFEHLGLFLQDFCLGQGSRSGLSGQTGEVEDRDTEDGPD